MFGKTVKQIRKSKNMTLKEVAGDTLSVSQLSRFENGKSMIPADLFYEVLENLNTTTEEFNYIKDLGEEDRIMVLFKQIEKYNNDKELDKLEQLKLEIQESHPMVYSKEYFLIYFIDSILGTYDYDEEELLKQHPVLEYLMQVEDWGEMELRLYVMFGFVLDIETTYFLMRNALKRSKQYLEVPAAKNLLHTILSNNFSTFLAFDYLDYAEETINLFEREYSEDTENIAPHIDFIFNKGLLAFKKDNPTEAKKYCEQAISVCRLFNQIELEISYEGRYKNWVNKYKDPKFKELMIKVN